MNVQRVSEVAHLRHFLSGTILFSSISPNFERNLKDELYGCFKYIGIPFDVLDRMPVRDRKFYIAKHNGITEEENSKNRNENTINGELINTYANIHQLNEKNRQH